MPSSDTAGPLRLEPAGESDLDAVAALVNGAYRGEAARAGWTTEADLLDGQRTDPAMLRADLAARPDAALLVLRESGPGSGMPSQDGVLGCVWAEPHGSDWHIGMLSVRPDLQAGGLGRRLLDGAEAHARRQGGRRAVLHVIEGRDSLIAWYERRGYRRTGATEPFPHGDERFGRPRRPDLRFLVLDKPL